MTALTTLPPGIRSYLDEFIARSRWLALLRSSGLGTALFLGWMLVACVTDRYVHLPESARVAALLIGIAAFLACVGPAMLAFRRRPDWVSAAASVERHNPRFRQRLLTVTSRVLGAADYRGSDEILLRLVHEVDEELSSERTSKMLPVRQPLASWTVAVLLLVLIAGLSHLAPSLRFNALAIRFLDPLANVPPVTTTELSVTPGDFEIVQAQPLVIRATAARLGNRPLMLHLSDDARSWSHVAMIPAGSDAFAFTLASVDRDLRYFLSGGDARTPEYSIRVLRKPVVAQFRIHYEYPAYTRLPITVETNSTGRIEAPVGTKVLLTITSSEPLQDALLTIGGERILMDRTADPHIRQAALVVRNGGPYSIDLISARDVPGFGPSGMSIHALVDSPPQVHLARQGDSLRLRPRDVLPLTYEALDDYGIQALFVRAQLGRKPAGDSPVRIWGDPRRQQDTYTFDLANLQLAIGDVLTLTLFATDTAGHTTHSDPLYVLISPKATDVDAYDRLAELRSAGQLAGTLASELQDAAKAHDEVAAQKDRHSQVSLSAISRGDRALTSASQTVTLLRQALLRAMVHSPGPAFSLGLAQWIDAGEIESAVAQETFRQSGSPSGLSPAMGRQLAQAAESANRIRDQMNDLAQSEQASLLLSDREDLADAGRQPRRSSAALDRMKKEFDAQAAQAGLDPASADFERQLRNRVAAGQHLLEAARPLDFAPAVETWAGELKRDPQQRLGLESRLAAAAQAEALRPDADLPRARDLELASRAAAAISTSARGSGQLADAQTLSRFVHDVALLLDEKSTSPGAAGEARAELQKLAGDADPQKATTRPAALLASGDRQKETEDMAMQAGAAGAEHQYQQASALDRALIRRLTSRARREPWRGAATAPATLESGTILSNDRIEHHRQAVQRELSAAQRMDNLTRRQQELAKRTSSSTGDTVATGQETVAEEIASIERQRVDVNLSTPDTGNARDQATAAVLAAQEQLAAMPQALAQAQLAAAVRRESAALADAAVVEARTATRDHRDAAQRAAGQARQNAKDAADRLLLAMRPVAPAAAEALSRQLEPFVPETESARVVISEELLPSLQLLEKSLNGPDGEAVDFAASDVRLAIEDVQRELSSAQDQLTRRDPLMAARWFARAAAQSLTRKPPDLGSARRHQADVSAALSRAWDQSIHRAAAERLALLPSLAAVLGPPSPRSNLPGDSGTQSTKFTAAREWGRLRAQDGPEIENPLHDSDPPGYEQALKLYFEALGRAEDTK